MSTTLQTLTAKQTELQEKLEKARKAKKSTKDFREALAKLEAQIEAHNTQAEQTQDAPKRGRGRPRKYRAEYYTLKESFKRANRRGRPTRVQVEADLQALGVEVNADTSFRDLEVALRDARAKALEQAK